MGDSEGEEKEKGKGGFIPDTVTLLHLTYKEGKSKGTFLWSATNRCTLLHRKEGEVVC